MLKHGALLGERNMHDGPVPGRVATVVPPVLGDIDLCRLRWFHLHLVWSEHRRLDRIAL
jgi:hypothetical protein